MRVLASVCVESFGSRRIKRFPLVLRSGVRAFNNFNLFFRKLIALPASSSFQNKRLNSREITSRCLLWPKQPFRSYLLRTRRGGKKVDREKHAQQKARCQPTRDITHTRTIQHILIFIAMATTVAHKSATFVA